MTSNPPPATTGTTSTTPNRSNRLRPDPQGAPLSGAHDPQARWLMTIPAQGWGGGYATESFDTGSIYLPPSSWSPLATTPNARCGRTSACTRRRGRPGVRWGAASSAPRSTAPATSTRRTTAPRPPPRASIQGFHELDGRVPRPRRHRERMGRGQDRNVVKVAVEPDHPDYAKLMGVPPKATGGGTSGAPAQAAAPAIRHRRSSTRTRDGQTVVGAVREADEMLGLQTTSTRLRPPDGRFKTGDPRRYVLDWVFCSRRCRDAFHALYGNWQRPRKAHRQDGGRHDRSV